MSRARRKGKPPRVKEDWIDPFVRSQVGWKADAEAKLLVKLLGAGGEIPISKLSSGETKLLPKLEKAGHVEVDKGTMNVKLTVLGSTIARGAEKMYPEFWE
jgi:hypothetical protein